MTAVFLPLMTIDQPDTAERVRLAVQSIPFALPEKMLRAGLDTDWRSLSRALLWDAPVTLRACPSTPPQQTHHNQSEGTALCQ